MTANGDLGTIVDAIYEAGLEPGLWPSVIRAIAESIGGTGGGLHAGTLTGTRFGFDASWNVDPTCLELYANHYFAINPLNAALLRQPAGAVVGDHELVSREIVRRSEAGAFLKPFGIEGSATVVLANGPKQVGALGIVRNNQEVFSKSELRLLDRFKPHLGRAVAMNYRLERVSAEGASLQSALDQIETAIMLLDDDGHVRRMNPSAENLISQADGLSISQRRLVAQNARDNSLLGKLVHGAVQEAAQGGELLIERPSGLPSYFARICPLPSKKCNEFNFAAVVFIADPCVGPHSSIATLLKAYQLTPAESAVVIALVGGMTLQAIANDREITITTARNHLKRAMVKADVHSQADLVRLVLASRVPVFDPRKA